MILLTFSVIVTTRQYVGNPIDCIHTNVRCFAQSFCHISLHSRTKGLQKKATKTVLIVDFIYTYNIEFGTSQRKQVGAFIVMNLSTVFKQNIKRRTNKQHNHTCVSRSQFVVSSYCSVFFCHEFKI